MTSERTGNDKIPSSKFTIIGEPQSDNWLTSFEVERETGEKVSFTASHRHAANTRWRIGHRYEVTNIERRTKGNQEYLGTTKQTTVQDITDCTEAVTLLATGDTHIGYFRREKPTPGYQTKDCYNGFQAVIDQAIASDVDGLIHTGDLFDHNAVSEDYDWVEQQISRLDDHNIAFLFVLGNHDQEPTAARDSVEQFEKAMYIGGGHQREYAGFTFIGFDNGSLNTLSADFIEEQVQQCAKTPFLVVHPRQTEYTEPSSKPPVGDVGSRCYVFSGHHHECRRYDIGEGVFVYAGSPMGITRDSGQALWSIHALNGYCTISSVQC